jgi:hypothetical protein
MTTIITRLYPDEATAETVARDLLAVGHPASLITVIPAGANDPEGAMKAANVPGDTAAAVARVLRPGQAVLVAEAGFNPRGAARRALMVVANYPGIPVPKAEADAYVRDDPQARLMGRVIKGGMLVMTNPFNAVTHGHIMGKDLVMMPRVTRSANSNGGTNSRGFWPMARVRTPQRKDSVFHGGKLMFPFAAIIHRGSDRTRTLCRRRAGGCAPFSVSGGGRGRHDGFRTGQTGGLRLGRANGGAHVQRQPSAPLSGRQSPRSAGAAMDPSGSVRVDVGAMRFNEIRHRAACSRCWAGMSPRPPARNRRRCGARRRIWTGCSARAARSPTQARRSAFRYRSPAHFIEVFRIRYGPMLTAFAALDDARRQALGRDLRAQMDEMNRATDGPMVVDSACLEVVVTRR